MRSGPGIFVRKSRGPCKEDSSARGSSRRALQARLLDDLICRHVRPHHESRTPRRTVYCIRSVSLRRQFRATRARRPSGARLEPKGLASGANAAPERRASDVCRVPLGRLAHCARCLKQHARRVFGLGDSHLPWGHSPSTFLRGPTQQHQERSRAVNGDGGQDLDCKRRGGLFVCSSAMLAAALPGAIVICLTPGEALAPCGHLKCKLPKHKQLKTSQGIGKAG